ncbi:hypothetical protein C1H46_031406 [Malus baccata]|uniref:Uncharacterized protein n=1 Tax=Malus baccata TaxID=106549 RepID=A0A540L989_MALBA|nr:hypothetical protein C1H46_031406 [Malus baccata]
MQCQPESQLKFITEAWQQLFEYLQGMSFSQARRVISVSAGEAESGLERLHQCPEDELQDFAQKISMSSAQNLLD